VGAAVFTTITSLLTGAYLARKRAGLVLAQASVFNVVRLVLAVGFAASRHVVGLIGAWALGLAVAAAWGATGACPGLWEGAIASGRRWRGRR